MKIHYTIECDDREFFGFLTDSMTMLHKLVSNQGASVQTRHRHQDDDDDISDVTAESQWPDEADDADEVEEEDEVHESISADAIKPETYPKAPVSLPHISDSDRANAKQYFMDFCVKWAENFNSDGAQPDRVKLMQDLGSSRHLVPILIMAYEKESLQALVVEALKMAGWSDVGTDIWQFADKMAAVMTQVSHFGCPDLAGTYDYSSRWSRRKNA